jgi:Mn2+/Fe2+ NRAMP family transporter
MTDTATNNTTATSTTGLVGWRAAVHRVYRYLIGLYVVAIVVLIFLAGEGIFGDHATKIADAKSLDPHRALGSLLGLVAVVLFLLALAARVNRSTVIRTLILAVLALVAQPALAGGGENNKWVGGFHVIDGIIILGLSAQLAYEAHRRPAHDRAAS